MQTTHIHTQLGAQRRRLALALALTLFIITLGYFGVTATRAARGAGGAPLFATITVNNNGDTALAGDGKCTLREAINNANNGGGGDTTGGDCTAGVAGLDTIDFNIGAGTPSIAILGLALPAITEPVIINGNTSGATRVELNGTGAGAFANGLTITAGGSTIRALVINRFGGSGIAISSTGGNTIVNCFIGTDVNGTADLGNGGGPGASSGVFIQNTSNNTIGGTTAGERNIISGNDQYGVVIASFSATATGNKVLGNYIGTDVNGTSDLGNTRSGVLIQDAPTNTIGGTTAAERNLISGNDEIGVFILGTTATGNKVSGNYIGTDVNGTADLGNTFSGVFIGNGANNIIGGTMAGERNIISGNEEVGVYIAGPTATGNKVTGNYIGTDVTGTLDRGNGLDGVFIGGGAPNNTIGGTTAAERNLISGNDQHGVYIINNGATGNKVSGNYIGTDVTGTLNRGNARAGVRIEDAPNNTIGGTMAAERNIISGNTNAGVNLMNANTKNNVVVGNYIGTDVNGASALPNGFTGVIIQAGASNNTIGGTTAGARNIISGNKEVGLAIQNPTSTGNLVQGNYIGVAANGATPLGNVAGPGGNPGWGVAIVNAPGNTIGGTAAGAGNLIANNADAGVGVFGSTAINNPIWGNSIFANNALGIDLGGMLGGVGVTPNDAGDPDAGQNNLQNFPVLTSVSPAGVITGTLDSLPANTAYPVRLEFFANTSCDPSHNGEGEVFLGFITVNAPGNFTTPAFAIPAGKPIVTATATDNNGNTSEFSACFQNVTLYTGTLTDPLACTGPGSLVTGTIQLGNPAAITQAFTLNTTFTNLAGVPGSCTLTGAAATPAPSCTVTAGGLTASGNLPANTTLTVQYQAQVADVPGGTTVTASNTATLNNATVLPDPLVFTRALNCPTVGPGLVYPASGELSDQRPGSVLVYNLYSSSIAAPNQQNTRISITNTNPGLPIAVHLFFVDGATCSIADSMICLTPNQTASFLASDIDPGTTGYIVAVASNLVTGCPVDFNYLIGDEYVKLSSGHAANLSAEGFAALAGGLPACNGLSVTALLSFDGASYNRAPRVLAASNIPSRADGNDTLIVLNRFGGSLVAGASTLGALFGILYDDAENPLSFTFTAGVCQFRSSLSSSFPRTAPRFEQFIPAGRSGWARFYSQSDIALLGAQINFNANAGTAANAFNQGHNLHKLTLTTAATLTIPIFPPNC